MSRASLALVSHLEDIDRIEAILSRRSPHTHAVLQQHLRNVRRSLVERLRQESRSEAEDAAKVMAKVMAPRVTVVEVDEASATVVSTDPCPICCETHERAACATTGCQHVFGKACLDRWCEVQLRRQCAPTCPLCKTQVVDITHHIVVPPSIAQPV
jgi:hypothetical protein